MGRLARDNEELEWLSPDDAKRRLAKTLGAAFNMRPTPLKDIPTKEGPTRVAPKRRETSRANVKSVRPKP